MLNFNCSNSCFIPTSFCNVFRLISLCFISVSISCSASLSSRFMRLSIIVGSSDNRVSKICSALVFRELSEKSIFFNSSFLSELIN